MEAISIETMLLRYESARKDAINLLYRNILRLSLLFLLIDLFLNLNLAFFKTNCFVIIPVQRCLLHIARQRTFVSLWTDLYDLQPPGDNVTTPYFFLDHLLLKWVRFVLETNTKGLFILHNVFFYFLILFVRDSTQSVLCIKRVIRDKLKGKCLNPMREISIEA